MRIVRIIVFLLAGLSFLGLTWYGPNQRTISWDPIIQPGLTYRVYLAPKGQYGQATLQGETSENTFDLTLTEWGNWVTGVSAVEFIGTSTEEESAINWSDINGASTPDPFGFKVRWPPDNLREGS